MSNDSAAYVPVCFIDQDEEKVGREIMGLPIYAEGEDTLDDLKDMGVQEIVFAITNIVNTKKEMLFNFYRKAGYKVKVYDFSVADIAKSGKRVMREFDIDELLFRQPIVVNNEFVADYYKGKVILVTGGGGSIGSELCRQLAKMQPKQIVALDIYENGVLMAGGGAMLGGLRKLVEHTLKVRCVVAKDAMNCVAKGTAIAFKNIDNLLDGFENIAIYQYQA